MRRKEACLVQQRAHAQGGEKGEECALLDFFVGPSLLYFKCENAVALLAVLIAYPSPPY
jgi:hypothetical protein